MENVVSYPLSPMQQGMLYHNLARESGVDIEQIVCSLREDLNVEAFENAWADVAGRYEVFRTSFAWEGLDEPVQRVQPHVALALDVQDWRKLSGAEQQERLNAFLEQDRGRGFNLNQAPFVRLTLLRLGEADYTFIWTLSHAMMDGRSFTQVLAEVFDSYDARRDDRTVAPESPRDYRDYIDWLHNRDATRDESFWRRMLKGFTAPTPLPATRPSGVENSQRGDRGEQSIELPVATTSTLRVLAEQSGLTLNTMVQGAWALLLSRYSGERDVVFGATRACRRSSVEGADSMVGLFINTVPMRVQVSPGKPLLEMLTEIRDQHVAIRDYEHTPLVKIQQWSDIPGGSPLFESIVVFENYLLNSRLKARGKNWDNRDFELRERTSYALTLYGYAEPRLLLKLAYDKGRFDEQAIRRIIGQLKTLLQGFASNPRCLIGDLQLLDSAERRRLLVEWNDTRSGDAGNRCIHQLIEQQAARTPEAPAIAFENETLSYRELDERANQVSRYLRNLLKADRKGQYAHPPVVGICVERSAEMVVGLLGILKSGAAYLPLDPAYPQERLAFMMEDARAPMLLTQSHLVERFAGVDARIVQLDADRNEISKERRQRIDVSAGPDDLAYVIYTSGSTGKPKGAMVTHRNVVNFFSGMDRAIGNHEVEGSTREAPGVWLAVTSISFDISVLELFWTLARGFKVVVYGREDSAFSAHWKVSSTPTNGNAPATHETEFSLFYFASADESAGADKYKLLIEGARFADQNGFAAIWSPERHFHEFGGLYPNPSVISAMLSGITGRIQIRAGSVVLPLHSTIRVAEEWSVVDNLSNGRIGISFASGWHADDFVLAPDNYTERKEIMLREIEVLRSLWRGETVTYKNAAGRDVDVKIFPRPVQKTLPIWITAAGSPATFRMAGEIGAGLLTHLLGQNIDELAKKIEVYRTAWRESGHGPEGGHVTLMLHTFVGENIDSVREKVRVPFIDYLKTSSDLVKKLMQSIDAGKRETVSEAEMQSHWDRAFERYFSTSGLFGTPQSCLQMIDRLSGIGVNEIACLIDFGVEVDEVLSSLSYLNELKDGAAARTRRTAGSSLSELIERHQVTHMQCTPSMARMVAMSPGELDGLRRLRKLMLGGETLPASLAEQLTGAMTGDLHNMYGPTETTIWSATHRLNGHGNTVPIGRPIVNTETYILDGRLEPVPIGVAGELYIGGAGVIPGYLNRSELTAERFIPNPFSAYPGTRLYRTGDLARYLPDGNIEFLGRVDQQVKIRGFRIELGEIEAVLEQHPSVREAVVTARDDSAGAGRLVAYFTSEAAELPVSSLRGFLEGKLPEHMLPSAFVRLSSFPLTPNGKVNRLVLPDPDVERPDLTEPFVAPRTPVEKALAEIWSATLGVERIGAQDRFFDLGGNSLSAVQIAFKIRQAFKIDIPLQFFQTPTLAGLAQKVEEQIIEQAEGAELDKLFEEIETLTDEEIKSLIENETPPGAATAAFGFQK
jgi:natural product biosynthesis luciferase-like monooxygenase protein